MDTLIALSVRHAQPVPGLYALEGAPTPADITMGLLYSPGFGTTSLGYLALVLAKEVTRLQNQIDAARAVLGEGA